MVHHHSDTFEHFTFFGHIMLSLRSETEKRSRQDTSIEHQINTNSNIKRALYFIRELNNSNIKFSNLISELTIWIIRESIAHYSNREFSLYRVCILRERTNSFLELSNSIKEKSFPIPRTESSLIQ